MNVFSRGLTVRLLILCGIACLFAWSLFLDRYWATRILLALLFAGMILETVRYAGNPQQRISSFMESLPVSSDLPVLALPAKDEAEVIFRRLTEIVQQIKTEKQIEYELFVATTNHLAVALLVFDRNERVKLCNKAALQLFRMPSLATINQLAYLSRELAGALMRIQAGEQLLVKTDLAGRPVKLSVRASQVQFTDGTWNIVTLQDIQQEIAQEETEAWQKIIRILAHEIINSTSPINLLTGSLEKIARKGNWTETDRRNMEIGLQAIGKRSRGMTSFVENYRTMTAIPVPVFALTGVNNLLQRIGLLFGEEVTARGIEISVITSGNMTILTDEHLLEQVLINLVRNAIDAADKPHASIGIKAGNDGKDLLVEVSDNGCGIIPENLGSVFTPFFTTKSAGTGIGLFISRKIAQALHGTLTVQSIQKQRTVFSLRIPCDQASS
jgi:nitrogen fixation/metabolism regulation signal transduction histidine kinase